MPPGQCAPFPKSHSPRVHFLDSSTCLNSPWRVGYETRSCVQILLRNRPRRDWKLNRRGHGGRGRQSEQGDRSCNLIPQGALECQPHLGVCPDLLPGSWPFILPLGPWLRPIPGWADVSSQTLLPPGAWGQRSPGSSKVEL